MNKGESRLNIESDSRTHKCPCLSYFRASTRLFHIYALELMTELYHDSEIFRTFCSVRDIELYTEIFEIG